MKSFLKIFFKYFSIGVIFSFILFQLMILHRIDDEDSNGENFHWKKIFLRSKRISSLNEWNVKEKRRCSNDLPSKFDLDYNNIYWQRYQSSNGTMFYLYKSYWDIRSFNGQGGTIRILSMINRLSPPKIFCQIWFDNHRKSLRIEGNYHYLWFSKWGNYRDGYLQPFLINCPLNKSQWNKDQLRPRFVSIEEESCAKLSNSLPIEENDFDQMKKKKEEFAVCVKGLDFPAEDLSIRLIEWIELLKLLGTKKICFYRFEIHENVSAVLNYYLKENFIRVDQLTLPGSHPNLHSIRRDFLRGRVTIRRQHEILPYNDCFYRNLYHYQYILLLDIDEILLPLHEDFTWIDLFQRLKQSMTNFDDYAAYSARNIYFFHRNPDEISKDVDPTLKKMYDSIPNYFHFLKQIHRSRMYTRAGSYVKTFFRTDRVIGVHNHFPMGCFRSCRRYEMNTSFAHLQHYRNDCVKELKKTCQLFKENFTSDFNIWKYSSSLIQRTHFVAKQLNLIH